MWPTTPISEAEVDYSLGTISTCLGTPEFRRVPSSHLYCAVDPRPLGGLFSPDKAGRGGGKLCEAKDHSNLCHHSTIAAVKPGDQPAQAGSCCCSPVASSSIPLAGSSYGGGQGLLRLQSLVVVRDGGGRRAAATPPALTTNKLCRQAAMALSSI